MALLLLQAQKHYVQVSFGRGLHHQAEGLRVCGPPTALFMELVPHQGRAEHQALC